MSNKKQHAKDKFPEELIREWENSAGVNFAVALARLTGWLLHVDWWTPRHGAAINDRKNSLIYSPDTL